MKIASSFSLPRFSKIILVLVAVTLLSLSGLYRRPGARLQQERWLSSGRESAKPDSASTPKVARAYGHLPLSFEAGEAKDFVVRRKAFSLSLNQRGASVTLRKRSAPPNRDTTRLNLQLRGARPNVSPQGLEKLPGKVNYLIGNDPRRWRTNIDTYAKVLYQQVYPGIDLVYYGNERQLEYDFKVQPGIDARKIRLGFQGSHRLRLNEQGDLVVAIGDGEVLLHKPISYQEVAGSQRDVRSRFQITSPNEVAIRVGAYDRSLPLVIDPVLSYSTYIGGSVDDEAYGIAVDSAGNAYLTGLTNSPDFPASPLQTSMNGVFDAFVTKLNASGTAIVYSTYVGGSGLDWPNSIAVDDAGNAYVAGQTQSSDFPLTNALHPTLSGFGDGMVFELNASGSAFVYSTYLGGKSSEIAYGIAVDQTGAAYVVGRTDSRDFPTTNAFQSSKAGNVVFKTTNGAVSWSPSDNGLDTTKVNRISFDPSNSSVSYAAATGGIYKSTDGGNHWGLLAGQPPVSEVVAVALEPSNPSTVYAATTAGVYKSTDEGLNFSRLTGLSQTPFRLLILDPTGPGKLYAVPLGSGSVSRSSDGGITWTSSALGTGVNQVMSLVLDPVSPLTIYAGTNRGVFKSTNGAVSWSASNTGFQNESVRSVAVDPANSSIVYFGSSLGMRKSTNGGANWTNITNNLTGSVAAIVVDPSNSSVIYAGASTVYKSIDGGSTWNAVNNGFPITPVNSLTFSPGSSSTLFIGSPILDDVFLTKLGPGGSSQVYSTYLGGSANEEAHSVAVDSLGRAHITGTTTSSNFPTMNPLQSNKADSTTSDGFIVRFDATGMLEYSTYLGGSGVDGPQSIALDGANNIYIGGFTLSPSFPGPNGSQPTTTGGFSDDVFVTKLNAAGSAIVYTVFLGGDFDDDCTGIAVDSNNNVYLTGITSSGNFPLADPLQASRNSFTDAFIAQLTPGGTLAFSTYFGGSSDTDNSNAIAVDSSGAAYITGGTSSPNFPTVNPLRSSVGAEDAFVAKLVIAAPTPTPTPTPTPKTIRFDSAVYVSTEASGFVLITVIRNGDSSAAAAVAFATSDGTAREGKDYTSAFGVVSFAAGEASKTFPVLIIDNGYVDGSRSIKLTLSNPSGAALTAPGTAVLSITDNDALPATINPIDQTRFFVEEHYFDFLNRYPDQGGWDFWSNDINSCGADQTCVEVKRINVSAAYFLSIEFQQTGYLVERIHKTAFGDAVGHSTFPNAHELVVPIVRLNEFLPDMQQIGRGLVVGQPGWETVLENNKQAFALEFVQRSRFTTTLPTSTTPAEFVDRLFLNAGVTPSTGERQSIIAEFGSATTTTDAAARGRALRRVAENSTLTIVEFNRAFVLMQFFGYLRRDPNSGQDTDYTGFDFWLTKLNQFSGDFAKAEMVKAFINSTEYRQRFAP